MEDRSYRHLLERAAEHYPSRTETLEIIRGALDNAANRELLFEAARMFAEIPAAISSA